MSRLEKVLAVLAVLPFGLGFSADVGEPLPEDDGVVFTFTDPEIIESSGLLVDDGLFATVNDSGDSGRVFTVDPADGSTVAVTAWEGGPEDVEAMARLPGGDVLVGDIGDNSSARESVELLRVPFGVDGTVDPTTYDLVYPDGSHDAETLLVHPETGEVLVVAKEFIGRLYAAPEVLDEDSPNTLELLGEVLPIATDGAFFADGDHFVLRGYGDAAFYRWPSLEEVGTIDLPQQPQGEGIAVDDAGVVYISSEGQNSKVLRVDLPPDLRAELDGTAEEPTTDPTDPSTDPTADPTADPGSDDEEGADGSADADDDAADRPVWPWALGGGVGVLIVLVLLRSLRPRP